MKTTPKSRRYTENGPMILKQSHEQDLSPGRVHHIDDGTEQYEIGTVGEQPTRANKALVNFERQWTTARK